MKLKIFKADPQFENRYKGILKKAYPNETRNWEKTNLVIVYYIQCQLPYPAFKTMATKTLTITHNLLKINTGYVKKIFTSSL